MDLGAHRAAGEHAVGRPRVLAPEAAAIRDQHAHVASAAPTTIHEGISQHVEPFLDRQPFATMRRPRTVFDVCQKRSLIRMTTPDGLRDQLDDLCVRV
jgi:hypothetical protein